MQREEHELYHVPTASRGTLIFPKERRSRTSLGNIHYIQTEAAIESWFTTTTLTIGSHLTKEETTKAEEGDVKAKEKSVDFVD